MDRRGNQGEEYLDAPTGDLQSSFRLTRTAPRDCGQSAGNSSLFPLTVHGLSKSMPGRRHGLFADAAICADGTWSGTVRGRRQIVSVADAVFLDCSLPSPWTERGRGLSAGMDNPSLRPVCGQTGFADCRLLWT